MSSESPTPNMGTTPSGSASSSSMQKKKRRGKYDRSPSRTGSQEATPPPSLDRGKSGQPPSLLALQGGDTNNMPEQSRLMESSGSFCGDVVASTITELVHEATATATNSNKKRNPNHKNDGSPTTTTTSGNCCDIFSRERVGGSTPQTKEDSLPTKDTQADKMPNRKDTATDETVKSSGPVNKNNNKNKAPCGCGDNCQCGIENGWAFCRCGTNCQCNNPLMTEQASLVLKTVSTEDPFTVMNGTTQRNTASGSSTGGAAADLEAQHDYQDTKPFFVDIVVGGMTCTMCSQAITRAMNATEGVSHVHVSLSTDVAHIEFDPRLDYEQMVEEIEETISDIGYMVVDTIKMPPEMIQKTKQQATTTDAHAQDTHMEENGNTPNEDDNSPPTTTTTPTTNTQQDRWNRIAQRQEEKLLQRKRAFLWSLVGTLPILVLTMVLPHVLPAQAAKWWHSRHVSIFHASIPLESFILFALATPVQFWSGWDFYKGTYFGFFRSGTLNMDVLVCLGSTASYGYALYATFTNQLHESHFFETSAVLICFVLLGKWMQAVAVHRTSDALNHLMQLQPSTAIRVLPVDDSTTTIMDTWDPMKQAYQEEVVPTDQLQSGDIVKIVPGASLPADGVVLAGELAVDESMVTGESLPVLKTKDSVVLGGTVCVESSTASSTMDEQATTTTSTNDDLTAKAGQVAFCKVTGVGSSTALAQIIQLVQDAQASKVPMQNFADTVSSVFVPVVTTLSVVTFLVWYALCSSGVVPEEWYGHLGEDAATFSLMFGLACLVISCPCALGLAVPTAIMVGTGVGAKLGVLMKGGEAFEAASQVNAVVLDKTGTITTGKPAVTDFVLLDTSTDSKTTDSSDSLQQKRKTPPSLVEQKQLSRETILWLLGSLERSSEHPLAKAIVGYAEEKLSSSETSSSSKGPSYLAKNPFLQPLEFKSVTGRGASGYLTTDGKDSNRYFVAVGNRAFFGMLDVEVTTELDDKMKELEEQGKTAILAAVNYEFTVLLGVADELKPDAKDTVAYLRNEMKIDVWMVTGDNARTAHAIAQQLDLPPERVVSEALPNAKVNQVRRLQQQGKIVAHCGDGINDSPALAQANVGISMGTGAAIAAEASDMVLVRGQYVGDICIALDLCRVIFSRIQWNLVWSLIYNCLGIPLAAGVCFPMFHTRLPPTVAALAMALSSVSVVFSSLALRLYKPPVVTCTTTRRRSVAIDTNTSAIVLPESQEIQEPPAGTSRRAQLVSSLSLEVGDSARELTQPLLANDKAAGRMEEGRSD